MTFLRDNQYFLFGDPRFFSIYMMFFGIVQLQFIIPCCCFVDIGKPESILIENTKTKMEVDGGPAIYVYLYAHADGAEEGDSTDAF